MNQVILVLILLSTSINAQNSSLFEFSKNLDNNHAINSLSTYLSHSIDTHEVSEIDIVFDNKLVSRKVKHINRYSSDIVKLITKRGVEEYPNSGYFDIYSIKDKIGNESHISIFKNRMYGSIILENQEWKFTNRNNNQNLILSEFHNNLTTYNEIASCADYNRKVDLDIQEQLQKLNVTNNYLENCVQVDYGTLVDFSGYQSFENIGDAVSFVLSIMVFTESKFNNGQLPFNFNFVPTKIFIVTEDNCSPYEESENAVDLKQNFDTWAHFNDGFSTDTDLANLWTGMDVFTPQYGYTVSGIADFAEIATSQASTVNELMWSLSTRQKIITHEIGHTFGGIHNCCPIDGELVCISNPKRVMNPQVSNITYTWSVGTETTCEVSNIDNIIDHINSTTSLYCGIGEDIIFVNDDADGNGDGTSWQNAFTSLEDAVNLVNDCANESIILVAEGDYSVSGQGDENDYISISDCARIYGGFPNPSTTFSPWWKDRDADVYSTVITGELGDIGNQEDNSNYLFRVEDNVSNLIFDGLLFKSSNKAIQWDDKLFGNNSSCSLTIKNCKFENNYSTSEYIGGNSLDFKFSSTSMSLVVEDSKFIGNYSKTKGAVYIANSQESSTFTFLRNDWLENESITLGAGLALESSGHVKIEDCIFKSNISNSGSSIYFKADNNVISNLEVNKTLFLDNNTYSQGAIKLTNEPGAHVDVNFSNLVFNSNFVTSPSEEPINGYDLRYAHDIYCSWIDYGSIEVNIDNITCYNEDSEGNSIISIITNDNQFSNYQFNINNSILWGGKNRFSPSSMVNISNTIVRSTSCPENSNCINIIYNQNPEFLILPDPSSNSFGDLGLMATSPAVDFVMSGPLSDYFGTNRPQFSSFDLGAIERRDLINNPYNDSDSDGDGYIGDADIDDNDACIPDDNNIYCKDTDLDGCVDFIDPEDNNPCIPNPNGIPDGDCDGDGYTNQEETDIGTDPLDFCDPDALIFDVTDFNDFDDDVSIWDPDIVLSLGALIGQMHSINSDLLDLTTLPSIYIHTSGSFWNNDNNINLSISYDGGINYETLVVIDSNNFGGINSFLLDTGTNVLDNIKIRFSLDDTTVLSNAYINLLELSSCEIHTF